MMALPSWGQSLCWPPAYFQSVIKSLLIWLSIFPQDYKFYDCKDWSVFLTITCLPSRTMFDRIDNEMCVWTGLRFMILRTDQCSHRLKQLGAPCRELACWTSRTLTGLALAPLLGSRAAMLGSWLKQVTENRLVLLLLTTYYTYRTKIVLYSKAVKEWPSYG